MVQYYSERFRWIFHYTRKNFFYCLLKTLCIIVGLPIYAVCFAVEMVLTAVNLIFSWIPLLNVLVMLVCKVLCWLLDKPFYICVLPDLKAWLVFAHSHEPDYADITALAVATHDDYLPVEEPTAELTQCESELVDEQPMTAEPCDLEHPLQEEQPLEPLAEDIHNE